MQPINCILVEDELPALRYLQLLCGQLDGVNVVKSYNNPIRFLDEAPTLPYDTCVLDITMPGMDGVEVARRLQGKAIIFSTAYKTYAADAFELDAVDYLQKPYQLERLDRAFSKAREWLLAKRFMADVYLALNTSVGKRRIRWDDIAVVNVAGNDRRDKVITLRDGTDVLAKNITFGWLMRQLPPGKFCQISRKTMIALDTVVSYTMQWVYVGARQGGNPLQYPLSAPYREAFVAGMA